MRNVWNEVSSAVKSTNRFAGADICLRCAQLADLPDAKGTILVLDRSDIVVIAMRSANLCKLAA